VTPQACLEDVEKAAALAALRAEVPGTSIVDDPEVVEVRSVDASFIPPEGRPLCLIAPTSTDEVSTVLRIANARGIPVVPQGGLTGLAGGASAVEGAILLDLCRMDKVLRVDPVDQVAVVQPGVITEDLNKAVAAQGLFYPPDPASWDTCTIGGNVATNAGGMRCVKYGVTRDFVRTLEVVLADGTVIRTRPITVKAVAGLDMTSLFVGSEGTLGVITEITVALLPAPGPSRGVSAGFRTVPEAMAAANDIMAGPHRPSTLELLDAVVVDGVCRLDPDAGLPAGAGAWLLVLTDARVGGEDDIAEYVRVCRSHDALSLETANDPERVAGLLASRRLLNPAMRAYLGASLNDDVSVPRTRLGDIFAKLAELSEEIGLPIGTGGHVGDGNLHPVIAYDPADPAQLEVARGGHERIMALAVEFGGTISGEHGIGTEKLAALDLELTPRVRELQHALKAVLDPKGILNPGKKL
jgi:glycolate oxidase